jgi:hypothetical protein
MMDDGGMGIVNGTWGCVDGLTERYFYSSK